MGRAFLIAVLLVSASAAPAAAQQSSRAHAPAGGMWQSIPYIADATQPSERVEPTTPERAARVAPNSGPKVERPQRKPVAAAAPEPHMGEAAKSRELSRRIEILSPGTKLGEPMADPENPAWRRRRADRAGPDGRDFAVPLDENGQSGLIARGHREDPAWNNPNGNIGATFGLRTRF